jgi:flagellar protein FlaG
MIIQNIGTTQLPQVSSVSTTLPPAKVDSSQSLGEGKQLTTQQLNNAVNTLNKSMSSMNNNLEFSVDSQTKIPIIKVVDTTNGTVIVQMPTKVALAVAQSIENFQQRGSLIDQKV